ncbi:hypothetical protein [Actinacidiphila soli]|uniref:hypothetical protein n=1 Tax=Actinacidiphila soli TaxID=2487275 RepID=UPI000FC997B0|nr:hypothetical protein [Actinacidiphila soli]
MGLKWGQNFRSDRSGQIAEWGQEVGPVGPIHWACFVLCSMIDVRSRHAGSNLARGEFLGGVGCIPHLVNGVMPMAAVLIRLPDSELTVALDVDEGLIHDGDSWEEAGVREIASKFTDLGVEVIRKGLRAALSLAQIAKDEMQTSNLDYEAAELSFGISFSGGCDVKVVKGEAESVFNFTIHWRSDHA